MTRGDFVSITYNGKTVRAMVVLASPNGASLAFSFDGALWTTDGGIFPGFLPVLRDDAGTFRDLVLGEPVIIEAIQK